LFYFYTRIEKVRNLYNPYFLHVHLQHLILDINTVFIRAAFAVPIYGQQQLWRKSFSNYDISGAGLHVLWLLTPQPCQIVISLPIRYLTNAHTTSIMCQKEHTQGCLRAGSHELRITGSGSIEV
jgi:hypothetical protein